MRTILCSLFVATLFWKKFLNFPLVVEFTRIMPIKQAFLLCHPLNSFNSRGAFAIFGEAYRGNQQG
ncbi:hypothetical protein HMPREF0201_03782 [Cedecea davisae DSM 4568]|uniref:Uncharacterized protein n=1 Tax=Cedecea davisae DSM 4568 TaxID=566551 RepID=S3IME0_9ENTR|nr:hypothetical protein HMPREF0201_03782 [Cedecea davisae DSM 4568]